MARCEKKVKMKIGKSQFSIFFSEFIGKIEKLRIENSMDISILIFNFCLLRWDELIYANK
jgi:hypothetical protein